MDYFDKIKEALSDKLNGKELTLDSSFRDLGIDSLDLVDLVFALEEEIGTEFKDEELLSIKTVKDLLNLIDELLIAYDLDIDDVYCHYQFAKKLCPCFRIEDFKEEFLNFKS